MRPPPIRVACWGTGNTGSVALGAILERPEFELVAVCVARPENDGVDAGVLAGREPIDIVARRDPDLLIAAAPECVCYFGTDRGPSGAAGPVSDICRLLASGSNVVTTTMPVLVHPAAAGPEVLQRLEQACRDGGTSFLCTGIEPGFTADALVLQLSSLSREIRSIHVQEAMNVGGYRVHEWRSGLGRSLAEDAERYVDGHIARGWTGVLMLLADGLGVSLDAIREEREVAVGGRAFTVPAGSYGADDIAALRFRVIGEIGGRPTLIVEHVYRLLDEVAPEWPQPVTPDRRTTRIRIDGQPAIDVTLALDGDDLDPTGQGVLGTAMRAVNAVPIVVAAPSGVHTCLDLPLITGAGTVVTA